MPITFNTAISGLQAASNRIAAAANNIANASDQGRLPDANNPDAAVYQPIRAETVPVTGNGEGLGVRTILTNLTPGYRVGFNPDSPDANENGEVAITNVDLATEFVESKLASVAYAANARVIAVAAEMDKRLLDELA